MSFMNLNELLNYNFPQEAISYFENQKECLEIDNKKKTFISDEFKNEIDYAKFYTLEEIKIYNVLLSTWEYRVNYNETRDPNIEKDGSYKINSLDLIKDVDGYSPEGILVWFPDLNQFGTSDCDHGVIYIFKDKSWNEIISDLFTYINVQWDFYNEERKKITNTDSIYDYCKPWELWDFIED